MVDSGLPPCQEGGPALPEPELWGTAPVMVLEPGEEVKMREIFVPKF